MGIGTRSLKINTPELRYKEDDTIGIIKSESRYLLPVHVYFYGHLIFLKALAAQSTVCICDFPYFSFKADYYAICKNISNSRLTLKHCF